MVRTEDRAIYNIDRREASDFLGVSERTVDRYIRGGKLTCKKVGHHVYLSKEELDALKSTLAQSVDHVSVVTPPQEESEKREIRAISTAVDVSGNTYKDAENQVYKTLFETTKVELDRKQKEVEMLNYRLGKIEFEIKNTIPLLEYSQEKDTLHIENTKLQTAIGEKEKILVDTMQALHVERKIKTIYLIIVVVSMLIITLGIVFYLGVYNGTIRIV